MLPAAFAAETYISIPSIPGEDPTPGYPGAISVSSLEITEQTLTISKDLDSASLPISVAAAQGTPLGTIRALLYNAAPASAPDAKLDFFNPFVSSYSINVDEEVSFAAENPLELYLEVPGIPGESSTPGHPNIMNISLFSLAGDFTIEKLLDGASNDLALASAQGTIFPIARLLLYDSVPAGAAPDAVIEFHDVLVSSYTLLVGPGQPLEQVSFAFGSLSQPVPEPATIALFAVAGAIATCALRRRKSVA
jgi:hypothetical protein